MQLQPQLGRRVDEDGRAAGLEDRARAGPPVPRVGRATDRAVAADLGHAERRARAEEREPHLLNCFDLEEVGSTGHVERNAGSDHHALARLGELTVEDLLPRDREHLS